MNKETYISVNKNIASNEQRLIELISSIDTYEKWWSSYNAKVHPEGQKIVFSPMLWVHLTLQIKAVSKDQILMHYVDSLIEGRGIWTIKALSENISNVRYEVFVSSKNRLINCLIRSVFFKMKHTRDLQRLIQNLNQI